MEAARTARNFGIEPRVALLAYSTFGQPLDERSDQVREALLALPRHGPRVFRFVSKMNGERLTPSGVSLMVTELAAAAGVRLSLKSLRRGFGCRYAGRVPAQVLQKLMRHASIRTTMDYYANVDDAAMEAVLGPRRNTPRNKAHIPGPQSAGHDDATD